MMFPKWLVELSIAVNELFGGQKGYTVCADMYYRRLCGCEWSALGVKIIDAVLYFDPQHCRSSYLLCAWGRAPE